MNKSLAQEQHKSRCQKQTLKVALENPHSPWLHAIHILTSTTVQVDRPFYDIKKLTMHPAQRRSVACEE